MWNANAAVHGAEYPKTKRAALHDVIKSNRILVMLSGCLAASGWGSKKEHEEVPFANEAQLPCVMMHTNSG